MTHALGVGDGVRAGWQLWRGKTVTFDRYVMRNDSSALYHLVESLPKLRKLAAWVPRDAVSVVDVGAHSGLFAAFAKERGRDAAILCIEPDPTLLPLIEQNLNRFNDCRVVCAAAAEVDGASVAFYRSKRSSQTSSLIRGAVEVFDPEPEELSVPTVTLDTLCADMGSIDVLKIDVQGAELRVVEGATKTLSRTRTLIVEASLLDEDVHILLARLKEEFGPPRIVNPVYAGADLAYVRD